MSQRITWIDCWKGIAILSVVAGHILDANISDYIFWFHMPLFFFISGFLYKEKHQHLSFFKRKFFHLIVPYISFLILFSLPSFAIYIRDFWQTKQFDSLYQLLLFTLKLLYGGQILTGRFGVFWFVTCLFFTQQIYNFIYTKFGHEKWLMSIIMLDVYCLAIIDYLVFKDFLFPWNINVVLMALPFYWLGHIAFQNQNIFNSKKIFNIAIIAVVIAALIEKFDLLQFTFDMKTKNYGIPIINLLIAIAFIVIIKSIAKNINKIKIINSITRELGTASMAIMYLHQPIQMSLKRVSFLNEDIIRLIAALLIPYAIYKIILKFSFTRKFLLGEVKNVSKMKLKSLSKV